MYSLATIAEPAEEPVDVPLGKRHVRIDHAEEDGLIEMWIAAARRYSESHCQQRWIEQTVRMVLDEWPEMDDYRIRGEEIEIPIGPVTSIVSVKYLDEDGAEQTVDSDDYYAALAGNPAIIVPKTNITWPTLEVGAPESVRVEFKVGAANVASVDERVKQAICQTLAYWSEIRGQEDSLPHLSRGLPAGALRLLDSLWNGA